MDDGEHKLLMMQAEISAVTAMLRELLAQLALVGPSFEAVVRDALDTAKDNLALLAAAHREPPFPFCLEHAMRITRVVTLAALMECDVRARSSRGEIAWSPRRNGN